MSAHERGVAPRGVIWARQEQKWPPEAGPARAEPPAPLGADTARSSGALRPPSQPRQPRQPRQARAAICLLRRPTRASSAWAPLWSRFRLGEACLLGGHSGSREAAELALEPELELELEPKSGPISRACLSAPLEAAGRRLPNPNPNPSESRSEQRRDKQFRPGSCPGPSRLQLEPQIESLATKTMPRKARHANQSPARHRELAKNCLARRRRRRLAQIWLAAAEAKASARGNPKEAHRGAHGPAPIVNSSGVALCALCGIKWRIATCAALAARAARH